MAKPDIRRYCESKDWEIVGKLTRKYYEETHEERKGGSYVEVVKKRMYYVDEAGNEYHKVEGYTGYCVICADGGVPVL